VASRLYRTTCPLYLKVARILDQLGVAAVVSPTTAVLIALYVTGLLVLDARPAQTRVTRFLPGRATTRSTGCCAPRPGPRGAAAAAGRGDHPPRWTRLPVPGRRGGREGVR
jgi:hypothetical protein